MGAKWREGKGIEVDSVLVIGSSNAEKKEKARRMRKVYDQ
jgi:hypothetical protein